MNAEVIAKMRNLIDKLARMDTPTDGVSDIDEALEIMVDLSDERLFRDAQALYQVIREAREIGKEICNAEAS